MEKLDHTPPASPNSLKDTLKPGLYLQIPKDAVDPIPTPAASPNKSFMENFQHDNIPPKNHITTFDSSTNTPIYQRQTKSNINNRPRYRSIWVGNIDERVSREDLLQFFGSFPGYIDLYYMRQTKSAFVNLATDEAVEQAAAHFHGQVLFGSRLVCRPRLQRTNEEFASRRNQMSNLSLGLAPSTRSMVVAPSTQWLYAPFAMNHMPPGAAPSLPPIVANPANAGIASPAPYITPPGYYGTGVNFTQGPMLTPSIPSHLSLTPIHMPPGIVMPSCAALPASGAYDFTSPVTNLFDPLGIDQTQSPRFHVQHAFKFAVPALHNQNDYANTVMPHHGVHHEGQGMFLPNMQQVQAAHATNFDSCASQEKLKVKPQECAVINRYFVMKSLTLDDLELSMQHGVWSPQKHLTKVLDKAFKSANNVYLIFSVNKSGEFFGYARMSSGHRQGAPLNWSITHAPRKNTLDGSFDIEWKMIQCLPFKEVKHLTNPWNENKEVKVSRDGTELEPALGQTLLNDFQRIYDQRVDALSSGKSPLYEVPCRFLKYTQNPIIS